MRPAAESKKSSTEMSHGRETSAVVPPVSDPQCLVQGPCILNEKSQAGSKMSSLCVFASSHFISSTSILEVLYPRTCCEYSSREWSKELRVWCCLFSIDQVSKYPLPWYLLRSLRRIGAMCPFSGLRCVFLSYNLHTVVHQFTPDKPPAQGPYSSCLDPV